MIKSICSVLKGWNERISEITHDQALPYVLNCAAHADNVLNASHYKHKYANNINQVCQKWLYMTMPEAYW